MELLTGRLPFELEEGEEEEAWEALSTGRSSNEGCEAWVAHPDGGFRLGEPDGVPDVSSITGLARLVGRTNGLAPTALEPTTPRRRAAREQSEFLES